MNQKRKIINYHEASLGQLDAGTIIRYPNPKNGENNADYYYAVPSFLIIGAMKCGASELTAWLLKHHSLSGLAREWHFFDEVSDIQQEWKRYVISPHFMVQDKKIHTANMQLHTFEKTTEYFDKANRGTLVPEVIQKMMPSGKFIVLLRNPTDRVYSHYKMNQRPKKIRAPLTGYKTSHFGELIQDYFEKGEDSQYARDFRIGHYAEHLSHWLNYFSREQLLILFIDDFKKHPFDVMKKVQDFLGLKYFDYSSITEKTSQGLWVLKSRPTQNHYHNNEPMCALDRQLLNDYYEPWNKRLKQMFPELAFSW
ncbi:MAG: sulfotransferase domain-containing protein [Pseudomonadota bacterium]